MDKKYHRKHYEDVEEHQANKLRKQKQREYYREEIGFDDDEDEDEDLFHEVRRFIK